MRLKPRYKTNSPKINAQERFVGNRRIFGNAYNRTISADGNHDVAMRSQFFYIFI